MTLFCALSRSVVSDSLLSHELYVACKAPHGIIQARILEWVVISSSRGSSPLAIQPSSPVSPALAGRFCITEPPGKPQWHFLLLLLLSNFSRVRLSATPSLGFSRQEHWSGLPFPSPMHKSEKWKWSRSVVFDSSRPHGLQPTRLLRPWDFPGKCTGVGCHCLLRWHYLSPPKKKKKLLHEINNHLFHKINNCWQPWYPKPYPGGDKMKDVWQNSDSEKIMVIWVKAFL